LHSNKEVIFRKQEKHREASAVSKREKKQELEI
jgi:hypothetical protein